MLLLNLIGKKQSGKSTCAIHLVEKYGFVRFSFARHLKDTCKLLFSFTEEQVNGELKDVIDDRYGITPRKLIQWLSTEIMQVDVCKTFPTFSLSIGRRFWANKLIENMDAFIATGKHNGNFIIDDCRFIHEHVCLEKYAKDKNIRLINVRIFRDSSNSDSHISETELDSIPFDSKIINTTSVEKLKKDIEQIIS